ncbi:MAG: hypothetical protein M3011_11695 [Actinomycetota bacterium]|nr:hypothetical protein [Actinomycetota bacterium]
MALVVLALIWVAVLVPPVIRARSEGRPADSISAFRRQLTVLRRAHPTAGRSLVPDRPRAHAYAPGAGAPVTSLAARRSMATARAGGARPVARQALVAAGLPTSRARTLRRRRDVFVVLLATVAITLVMSLLLGLRGLLFLNLVADVLLGAYVALLIRQRSAKAEQDMKVRFLPGAQADPGLYGSAAMEPAPYRRVANLEPALYRRSTGMEPALLRRSAN